MLKLTDTHAKLQLKTDLVKCVEDMYNSDPIFDVELSKVQPSNEGEVAQDMVDMEPLNHATLLWNL